MPKAQAPRRPRKDGQQNRVHILDVARRAFASDGVDVSMDAIGRLAEVGAGTLYRHFPNKDALLAALIDTHYDILEMKRDEIESQEGDSGSALDRWIDALGDWMLAYNGLPEPLRVALSSKDSPLARPCDYVIGMTERFLRAAQKDGYARSTLMGRDIFLGALAIAWASGTSPAVDGTRDALGRLLKSGWLTSKCGDCQELRAE